MDLHFIPLVNANRLWIPEMGQMIEIKHFSIPILSWVFSGRHLWTWPRHPAIMRMFQNEPRLVLGQEIHKIRCLAMLDYFKKLMWHGNIWDFHVLFGINSYGTHRIWNFLISNFSWRISRHVSFDILKYLYNILHERKGCSRMNSTITCAN
jgi:hypothetical protein